MHKKGIQTVLESHHFHAGETVLIWKMFSFKLTAFFFVKIFSQKHRISSQCSNRYAMHLVFFFRCSIKELRGIFSRFLFFSLVLCYWPLQNMIAIKKILLSNTSLPLLFLTSICPFSNSNLLYPTSLLASVSELSWSELSCKWGSYPFSFHDRP